MICTKCKLELVQGTNFCPGCGKKVASYPAKSRAKSRGNGTGCAIYNKKTRTWTAQVVIGYRYPSDQSKQRIPVKKTKSGFRTREEALMACPALKGEEAPVQSWTLRQVYDAWSPWYAPRVASMAGYKSAFNHFESIADRNIESITVGDLQSCLDDCKAGKRTHQMMKVLAGLLWGYAADRNIVEKKITDNLYTGKGASKKRDALTEQEVKTVKAAIPSEPYAEYVYALCFLGFRPGELLELKKDQVHQETVNRKKIYYIIEGKKTDAGRDRIVTIAPAILPIIKHRLKVEGTDLLFPMLVFDRKGAFCGFKQMTDNYFRVSVFKPLMARLGIAEGKVPYAARHTFANKLKKVEADAKDKAALIGHSDYTFTQTQYQDTSIEERNAITSAMK